MSNLFEKIDIYGVGLSLRYNQGQFFQSKLGGIMTIVISILIGVQLFYSITDLIEKKSPEVIQSEQYNPNAQRFDMALDSFNFSLGVQHNLNNGFAHFIDESVYEVGLQQVIMKKVYNESTGLFEQKFSYVDIPLSPCREANFGVKGSADYFNNLAGINQMYCIDDINQTLYMEGNYDQISFGVVKFIFKICTGKPYCKTPEEIEKILSHSFVALYTTDVIVNPKDSNPYQKIGKDIFWNSSPTVARDIDIYYRNIYLNSDHGLYSEEIDVMRSTAYSYYTESVIFDDHSYFFQIQLRFEKQKETVIHRKYKKIDRVLAEIGGVAKALIMIGFFICFPINKLMLNEKLMNDLFTFQQKSCSLGGKGGELPPNDNEQVKMKTVCLPTEKQMSIINKDGKIECKDGQNGLQKQNQNILVSPFPLDNSQDKSNSLSKRKLRTFNLNKQDKQNNNYSMKTPKPQSLKIINNQLSLGGQSDSNDIDSEAEKIKTANIQLSWYQYIRYYLWPWGGFKKLKQQIEKSVQQVYFHLDIIQLVRFQLEFEKIKQLLFDSDQITLLQYLPKPVINIDELQDNQIQNVDLRQSFYSEQTNSIYYKKVQSQSQIKDEVENALNNIANKENMSIIDLKLINMLQKHKQLEVQKYIEQTPLYKKTNNFEKKTKTLKNMQNIPRFDDGTANNLSQNSQNEDISATDNCIPSLNYKLFPMQSISSKQIKQSIIQDHQSLHTLTNSNQRQQQQQEQLQPTNQAVEQITSLAIHHPLSQEDSLTNLELRSCQFIEQHDKEGTINKLPITFDLQLQLCKVASKNNNIKNPF